MLRFKNLLWSMALLMSGLSSLCARASTLSGEVRVLREGKPQSERGQVVVYLEGAKGDAPGHGTPHLAQRNLRFDPGLLVIHVGDTVEFPNEDKVFHNVFSLSRPARFDLGLYKSGTSKSVTFKQPGVVDVYCNIHPEMVAKIKVLETPFYAVTGSDGRFRITGVAPGSYTLVAWAKSGDELRTPVTIGPSGDAHANVELEVHEESTRHLRKDGTPYGRYK